jgi:methionyl aminopeptidase
LCEHTDSRRKLIDVSIDDPEELEGLRRIGSLIRETLELLRGAVRPGVTTGELDARASDFLTSRGARSGPILSYGYPGFICVSVDDEVVHGIPGQRTLRAGQLVTVDVAAELDGFHADAATTVAVGEISPAAERLMAATRAALRAGIRVAQPGAELREIGVAVERIATSRGFCVFPELTGHGIGRSMHEAPTVFNWPSPDAEGVLESGMVFTIEPMLGAGTPRLSVDADGWTTRTADGSISAHEEHTVVVAPDGPILLTA